MTWLLAMVGAALLAITFMRARGEDRRGTDRWWLYPVELGAACEPAIVAPRPGARPTAQTGAAVLALALALDVTSAAASPAEPQVIAPSHDAQAPIAWTSHSLMGHSLMGHSLAGDGWIL